MFREISREFPFRIFPGSERGGTHYPLEVLKEILKSFVKMMFEIMTAFESITL